MKVVDTVVTVAPSSEGNSDAAVSWESSEGLKSSGRSWGGGVGGLGGTFLALMAERWREGRREGERL